jgi:hypothetical protein
LLNPRNRWINAKKPRVNPIFPTENPQYPKGKMGVSEPPVESLKLIMTCVLLPSLAT